MAEFWRGDDDDEDEALNHYQVQSLLLLQNHPSSSLSSSSRKRRRAENEIDRKSNHPIYPKSSSSCASKEKTCIIHFDVDAFYVSCECIRRPELIGQPVAITQFNSGGFVAVSYEAKARGIRKGDGIGERGQKELSWFKNRPDAIMVEVMKRCPELIVLGMDMPYYRSISHQIGQLLEELFGMVMRNSLDDFYCIYEEKEEDDESEGQEEEGGGGKGETKQQELGEEGGDRKKWYLTCLAGGGERGEGEANQQQPIPPSISLSSSSSIPPLYRQAMQRAGLARRRIKEVIGVNLSAGIGPNKLLARLVSPMHKPNGQTLLLPVPSMIEKVLSSVPIENIPGLQAKRGQRLKELVRQASGGEEREVEEEEGGGGGRGEGEGAGGGGNITTPSLTLIDARILSKEVLVREFGQSVGRWIAEATYGRDISKGVYLRPPPSVLMVEASFNAAPMDHRLKEVVEPLCYELLRRLEEDQQQFQRLPTTLVIRYRLDYNNLISRSARLPSSLLSLFRQRINETDQQKQQQDEIILSFPSPSPSATAAGTKEAAKNILTAAAIDLLRRHLSSNNPTVRLTRLVVGASGFEAIPTQTSASIKHFFIPSIAAASSISDVPIRATNVASKLKGERQEGEEQKQQELQQAEVLPKKTEKGKRSKQEDGDKEEDEIVVMVEKDGEKEEEDDAVAIIQAAGYDLGVYQGLPKAVQEEVLVGLRNSSSSNISPAEGGGRGGASRPLSPFSPSTSTPSTLGSGGRKRGNSNTKKQKRLTPAPNKGKSIHHYFSRT